MVTVGCKHGYLKCQNYIICMIILYKIPNLSDE